MRSCRLCAGGHAEFGVAERQRLGGALLLIDELFEVDEHNLGRKRRLAAGGPADNAGDDRDIRGGDGMASGSEHVERAAIPKNTATWLSRTITCEPMRKSPGPSCGSRWTISLPVSSRN